jgi:hypothetical protein
MDEGHPRDNLANTEAEKIELTNKHSQSTNLTTTQILKQN